MIPEVDSGDGGFGGGPNSTPFNGEFSESRKEKVPDLQKKRKRWGQKEKKKQLRGGAGKEDLSTNDLRRKQVAKRLPRKRQ